MTAGPDPAGPDPVRSDPAGSAPARERDVLAALRASTRARVALGRAGDALPTARLLELRAAHAAARDAVHTPLDVGRTDLTGLGPAVVEVSSAAADRAEYLQRPDLGRRLAPGSDLAAHAGEFDVCLVVADGLSPLAVHRHAGPLLRALLARLDGWRVAPIVVARQARVALGDEVAQRLGARSVLVVVGERPGMSSTDSLGAYFTLDARPGRRDADRNCVSNIRPPDGIGYAEAAVTLAMLMTEASRLGVSGVRLKADPALGT